MKAGDDRLPSGASSFYPDQKIRLPIWPNFIRRFGSGSQKNCLNFIRKRLIPNSKFPKIYPQADQPLCLINQGPTSYVHKSTPKPRRVLILIFILFLYRTLVHEPITKNKLVSDSESQRGLAQGELVQLFILVLSEGLKSSLNFGTGYESPSR